MRFDEAGIQILRGRYGPYVTDGTRNGRIPKERDPETLYGYVGEGARRLVERALGPDDRDRAEAALAEFLRHYADHLLDATRPYPGMVAALEALAARGVTLSVLTNKPEDMSRAILDGLGLASHFLDVVGGDSLPTRKPEPEGLERLRARTATTRERMLLVGDSAVDVRTGRAAGVATCGVAWGLAPGQLFAERPDRLIGRPGALLTLVDARSA